MASVFALVVAAGQGSRFGGPLPKQYLPLGSTTLLRHAVAALAGHPLIANVLGAIRPQDKASFDRAVPGLRVMPPLSGCTPPPHPAPLQLHGPPPPPPHPQRLHPATP